MNDQPIETGLFEEDADGNVHLLGSRCRACGRHQFPRAATCPYCRSTEVEPVALSDQGTLWGFTAVTTAPPGYEGPVPFGFGVVELPEGLRVISRIEEADPARLSFGMPVKLTTVVVREPPGEDRRTTYSFIPCVSTS